ncbi:MAG: acyl-CoA thioesterase [Ostreibacterium sp.]
MKDKVKTPQDSDITLSELMLPSHSNFSGKIHGGYILNLMDQIAFACSSKYCETYCVTASINTVNFLQPIEVGELVTLKARINYVGKTSMTVGIRVTAENIKTGETKHCNSSYFVMVAKNKDGSNARVPTLKISTKTDARRFIRSLDRLKTKRQRMLDFGKNKFSYGETHKAEIEKHNVVIEINEKD